MRALVSRRHLLRTLALTDAAGAVGGFTMLRQPDPQLVATALVRVFGHPVNAVAVGRAHRTTTPSEASVRTLVDLVLASLGRTRADVVLAHRDALRSTVAGTVAQELGAAEVVRVEGWVLATTQVRLCALADALHG